jgi:segregation and condensation protein A
MAAVTRQYLAYVDEIRSRNLELAAEYLLMAAMLIEIKSRMLLPPKPVPEGQEPKTRAPNWCAACSNTSR